ncbi:MAG: VWA domain-containing protein [Sandaracinaceae bacterium]
MTRLALPSLVSAQLAMLLLACSAAPGGTPGRDAGQGSDAGRRDAGGGDGLDPCGDGLDGDRDGNVDEGCACAPGESQACFRGPPELAGIGGCVMGTQYCVSDFEFSEWDVCLGDGEASEEVCDGVDNDCDGELDEGCTCTPGTTRGCYFGPAGTEGVGDCRTGSEECLETSGGGAGFGACGGWSGPEMEVCGGGDEDCDGRVDEGCTCTLGETRSCYGGPPGTRDVGVCRSGTQRCESTGSGTEWGACTGERGPSSEVCTGGVDEDCDGTIDCADTDCGATCCMPYDESVPVVPAEGELLFVVDRSGSMQWPAVGTSASRWSELVDAMGAVLPGFDGLPMGLMTFPRVTGDNEQLNCMVSSGADVSIGLGTGSAILSRLSAAAPRAGDTPTPDAMNTASSVLSGTSSRERFVILATDGLPEPNCGATVPATVDAIRALRSRGVDTFVLGIVGPTRSGDTSGIPALQAALNQFADAGGRPRPGSTRYYEAVDGAALTSSLRAIVASATNCRFELPSAPPRPSRVTVRQDSTTVPGSGWTLTGRTLTFRGTYCDRIRGGGVSRVSVTDGC